MKTKEKVKWALDVLMTVALLVLMGYQFWGETAHEWIGAGMFILFLAHQILNWRWYRNLFRGKYTAMRILQLGINLFTLASMLALMYSGIVMSRHVFAFLPIESGLAMARRLHILGSYWGFILMSLHLGLHWSMVLGMIQRRAGSKSTWKIPCGISLAAGVLIAGYGISVFIRRDFLQSDNGVSLTTLDIPSQISFVAISISSSRGSFLPSSTHWRYRRVEVEP